MLLIRSLTIKSSKSFVKGLLVVLLLLQSLSLWHAAEHGFEHHEHDGQECLLDYYLQQNFFDEHDVESILINALIVSNDIKRSLFSISLSPFNHSYSRGPPKKLLFLS